jgi:hypothetical protein
MNVRARLRRLADLVADEADVNPEFAARIHAVVSGSEASEEPPPHRRLVRGRRPPAVIDPYAVYEAGADALRSELAQLDLKQLRDVIAEHAMGGAGLAARWKDPSRVVDFIVSTVSSRARKGEAFREPRGGPPTFLRASREAPDARASGVADPRDRSLLLSAVADLARQGRRVQRDAGTRSPSLLRDIRYDAARLGEARSRLGDYVSGDPSLLSTLDGLHDIVQQANTHADRWRQGHPPDQQSVLVLALEDARRIERHADQAVVEVRRFMKDGVGR